MLSYSQIPEGSEKDTEIWTAFWVESRLKQAFVSTEIDSKWQHSQKPNTYQWIASNFFGGIILLTCLLSSTEFIVE